MARRRNIPEPSQAPELAPRPEPAAPVPASTDTTVPQLLEYQPATSMGQWRVERFELMAAEFFDIPAPHLPASTVVIGFWQACAATFHDLLCGFPRQWLICRRLYGIIPLVPPANTQSEDLRSWPRAELLATMGLSEAELLAELTAVRAIWRQSRPAPVHQPSTSRPAAASELAFGDDVLAEFGFSEEMFEADSYDLDSKEYRPRKAEANRIERDWFCKRVEDWRKMLSEPMAATLAREALINELHLRRLSQEMSRHMPGSPRFRTLIGDKKDIEQVYLEQLSKLDEVFPWESAIGGKVSFRGCISELVDAWHKYKADGSTALVDRIHTAAEVELLIRQSVQLPVPRYRLGLNAYLIEAIHGLHDPNWKSNLKPAALKKLDQACQQAIAAIRDEIAEPLVDLEADGAAGEFPEVEVPKPTETLNLEPPA